MGEDKYGFRAMALMVGAIAIGGAIVTSETSGHFDRLNSRKPRPKAIEPAPEPAPEPTAPAPTNTVYTEASFVPTNFDINSELTPAWGSGAIPVSAVPDVVGAFRFICNAGQLLSDDPIAYPGQPGASHLHQFFGNMSANANSTYESLRQSGSSSCMSPLNRSGYWMPAMLDGKGNAVRPDWVSIYYKRRPISDPKCTLTSGDPKAMGNCIPLPNGLRFIFGYNMVNPADSPTGSMGFNCQGQTAIPGHYANLANVATWCPTAKNPNGSYNQLGAIIHAPSCWDGKNLDSADHRSHVAYQSYGSWGYARCPSTHPFVIPTFTMGAWYTVDENLGTWRLSSDEMHPGTTPGTTFHADWFGAWDNNVQAMWIDNCINKLLNCSGGDLGNGKQMKMFTGFSWTANPRLVPVPGQAAPTQTQTQTSTSTQLTATEPSKTTTTTTTTTTKTTTRHSRTHKM